MDDRTYIAYESDTGDGIMHYGVLGMKWGIRRYENPDGTLTAKGKKHYEKTGEKGYRYHSHSTKKYNRKAAKAKARAEKATDENVKAKLLRKAKVYEERAKRSDKLDRREEEYARSVSVKGNLLARSVSSVGGKAYQQHMAMANEKAGGTRFTGNKLKSASLASYGGTIGSRLAKAAYIRGADKKIEGAAQATRDAEEALRKKAKKYMK